MLKLLQARLQQYVNWEIPDIQAGFRKGRGTSDQIANICRIIEKAREFQKNIYLCFIDYANAFDCIDHINHGTFLRGYGKSNMETYITICKIDSQWEFAVWLWKLNQGLCINPEELGGEGDGREVQMGGDTCIPVADSCWGLTAKFYKASTFN